MRYWFAALALIAASLCGAGSLPNGDFENGLSGWQAVAKGAAQAGVSGDKPAGGKSCLLLTGAGADQAWAIGPALPGAAGELLRLSFAARNTRGQAKLLLNLVADPAGVSGPPVWESVLPADAEWHRVALLIKAPPGAPKLAFGVAGPGGTWALDEVDVVPGTAPQPAPATVAGEPVPVENLPEGWEPEGLLDAKAKDLAGQQELMVNVNGIEIGMLPTFTCSRGTRAGMVVYATNRAKFEKQLQIGGIGPVGVEAPAWTVPIKPDGTTRFHMTVQSLRQGTFWLKLTMKSGEFSASLPVKVTCQRQYPVTGLVWRGAVAPGVPQAQLGLDLNVLAAPPDSSAVTPMIQAATAAGGDFVVAPLLQGLTPPQYLAAVTRLYEECRPLMWMGAPDDAALASLSVLPRLVMELRKKQPETGYVSPPLVMTRDWQKNRLLPANPAAVTAERLAGVCSAAVQMPVLPPACVLREEVDGQADVVSGALTSLGRGTDLAALRELLSERHVNLPLLVGELRAAPTGDERLAALYLARAMTNAMAQGATGVLLAPQAGPANPWGVTPAAPVEGETPVQQVVRLLSRELAGAVPVVPLADSTGISAEPGDPVTYKPFLRDGEGIVVLWNNTSVPKNVTLEFRSQPVVAHRVAFSYDGEFAQRRWEPIMKFTEEAFRRGEPATYVRLEPLQVQVHTYRVLPAHAMWLRKLTFTGPLPPKPAESVVPPRDERSWWRDMLGGRKVN